MTTELSLFQGTFIESLLTSRDERDGLVNDLIRQPGFAVYRNTVRKACVDALQANFSAVDRLVGGEWFREAAAIYVQAEPPTDGRLLMYGATFPAFLEQFVPAAELPYLGGVARLDQLWIEAHTATDAPPLDRHALTRLLPEQLGDAVVCLHPAARWAWFSGQPIRSLWAANRGQNAVSSSEQEPLWESEGVLMSRPFAEVIWTNIEQGGIAFLDACAVGGTIEDAISAALAAQPTLDLAQLIAKLLDAGCLSSIQTEPVCPVQKAFP